MERISWWQATLKRLGGWGGRYRLYALCCLVFGLLACATVMFKPLFNFVVSDGRGYYSYLPSVVIDGDLDFSNQIREHWDVDFSEALLLQKTATGLIPNKYPIGFALSLLPGFIVAHSTSLLLGLPADGYALLYQLFALVSVLGYAFGTAILFDRVARTWFRVGPLAIAGGVLLFWFGTAETYYLFREPIMVHTVSLFWVALAMTQLLWLDQREPAKKIVWRAAWLGLAVGMAIVCRPTNALILVPFALALWRLWVRPEALVPAALCGVFPIVLQLFVWHQLYGAWVHFSYEGEGFVWAEPKLWQTLFSSKHGLFFWSPLLLGALWGYLTLLRATKVPVQRNFLIAGLVAAVLLWYANASWHMWWFGDAFGARAFLELGLLMMLGFAGLFTWLYQQSRAWRLGFVGFAVIALGYHYSLMLLYIAHKIPRADYLF